MTVHELIELDEPLEPETLEQLCPTLSPLEREIILVIKVIKDTRAAFEDMDVFENAVHVLNGVSPDISKMEGCFPEQIWRAVYRIEKIHPDVEYSDEVQAYIKGIFNDAGIYFYPPQAHIENPILNEVIKLANFGPFPLQENYLGIQASKYLYIREYITNL